MRKRISPSPLRLKVSNIAAADTSQVNCEKKREIKRAAFDNEWRKHLIMSAGAGFAGGSAQPN